jgi:hypothetical protein
MGALSTANPSTCPANEQVPGTTAPPPLHIAPDDRLAGAAFTKVKKKLRSEVLIVIFQ